MTILITTRLPKDYLPGLDPVPDRSARWLNGITEDSDAAEANIREFAAKVYERLVNIEAFAIGPLHRTYRFYTRVDIALVRLGNGALHFTLNEIQPGDSGIWSDEPDLADTVINALITALEDGCWMDPR